MEESDMPTITITVTNVPPGIQADYVKQKIQGYGATVTSITQNSDGSFTVVASADDPGKSGLTSSMPFSEINTHNVKLTPR